MSAMITCVQRVVTEVPEGFPGGDVWSLLDTQICTQGREMRLDEVTQGGCGETEREEH